MPPVPARPTRGSGCSDEARYGAGPLLEVGPAGTAIDLAAHRAVSTPRHVAYLRIADGCDFRCTFCIIPALRGDLRSRRNDKR